jgi:hypothetical protein
VSAEGRSKLPFDLFAPVPQFVLDALKAGTLSVGEFALVAVFYGRADRKTWIAKFSDLGAIAAVAAWPTSLNHLSKTLRRLRDEGWISFESKPGLKRHRYDIRLRIELLGQSEHCPSRSANRHAASETGDPRISPSRAASSPSSQDGATPVVERDSASADSEAGRALQRFSENFRPRQSELVEDDARAVGDPSENERQEAEMDRLWNASAPRKRPEWA